MTTRQVQLIVYRSILLSGEARDEVLELGGGRGAESGMVPLRSGEGFRKVAAPPQIFFKLLDQNGAFSFCALFFTRATHMQYIGIARYYAIGSVVCPSQGHKAVFYQRSSTHHHAINRKLR